MSWPGASAPGVSNWCMAMGKYIGKYWGLLWWVGAMGMVPVDALADPVDAYIRQQMDRYHVPGLALAVVQGGRVVKLQGYGRASVEHDVPTTVNSVFEIGSISKQMTAAAILLLVEEEQVDLDASIHTYIPKLPPLWQGVTLRHLLTHTSGIKNYTGLPGFGLSRRLNRAGFVHELSTYPLDFAPGDFWAYSNSGYNLLGYIIEQASGMPYWSFLKARIFDPLRMASTRDRDLIHVFPHRVTGYEWYDEVLQGRDYELTDLFAAGAIVSTVSDLVKWNAALSTTDFLTADSMKEMWKQARLNNGETYPYGFGWNIEEIRGIRRLRHNGQTAGFSSNFTHYPDHNLTIIILCNLGTIDLAAWIAHGLAKHYLPDFSLSRAIPIFASQPAMTRRFKTVVQDQLEGRISVGEFTLEARSSLVLDHTETMYRRMAAYGALSEFELISEEKRPQGRRLYYRAAIGERLVLFRFDVTNDARISSLIVEEEE